MKNSKIKNSKAKVTLIALTCALLCTSFVGCAELKDGQSDKLSPPQAENHEATTIDPDQVQIEHYEKLIKDLETMLLNEKQENYIVISEYKQTIANLESKIDELSKSAESSQPVETPSRDPNLNDQLSTTPQSPNKPSNNEHSSLNGVIYNNEAITDYKGTSQSPALSSWVNGVEITSIGEEAFKGSNIEKIIIPDGIVYIDWFAFADCKNLAEIYIPSSVTSIGYGAFENCSSFLVIKCKKGSYAEAYAQSWGIVVITE